MPVRFVAYVRSIFETHVKEGNCVLSTGLCVSQRRGYGGVYKTSSQKHNRGPRPNCLASSKGGLNFADRRDYSQQNHRH